MKSWWYANASMWYMLLLLFRKPPITTYRLILDYRGAAEIDVHFWNTIPSKIPSPQNDAGQWGVPCAITEPQAEAPFQTIVNNRRPDGDAYKKTDKKIFISGGIIRMRNMVHWY